MALLRAPSYDPGVRCCLGACWGFKPSERAPSGLSVDASGSTPRAPAPARSAALACATWFST